MKRNRNDIKRKAPWFCRIHRTRKLPFKIFDFKYYILNKMHIENSEMKTIGKNNSIATLL